MVHDIVDIVENLGLLCECLRPDRIQIKGIGTVIPPNFVNGEKDTASSYDRSVRRDGSYLRTNITA